MIALRQRAEDHPKRFLNFIFSSKEDARCVHKGQGLLWNTKGTRLQAEDNPEQLLGRGPGAFRPASAGNRYGRIGDGRGTAWRESVIGGREELWVRAEDQFRTRRGESGGNCRRDSGKHTLLLDLRDEAAMAKVLSVRVKATVQLWGDGEDECRDPERQHQSTCCSYGKVVGPLRCHPSLHCIEGNAQIYECNASSF
jgi:hypothetical protein